MSVSSLTRMTVPLANDQTATNQSVLMPKLKYRFRVVFENFGISTPRTELTKQVIDFTRPTCTYDNIDVHVYNSILRLAGKPVWGDVTCNLRDDVSGMVTRLVGEQNQKQQDFMEQSSAASGIDYKFTARVEMLDGGNGAHEPAVLETWEIYGAYLQSTNYNNIAYNASEVATITIVIRFDNALQTPLGSGFGTDVGRTIGSVITG